MPPKSLKIKETYIDQTFLNERYPPFPLKVITETRLDNSYLDWLLQDDEHANLPGTQTIGMHLAYTKNSALAALAICFSQKVLLMTDIMKPRPSQPPGRRLLQSKLLSASSGFRIIAFNAHELVLSLYKNVNLKCARVIDILSLLPKNRDVVPTIKTITGARLELFDDAIREAFQTTTYQNKIGESMLAQQAWLAWLIGNLPDAQRTLTGISPIDSTSFSNIELETLARSMEGLLRRDFAKPSQETIDVSTAAFVYQGNKACWEQEAFGKRLRKKEHHVVKANLRGDTTLTGAIWCVEGKKAVLKVQDLDVLNDPSLQSLTIVGRASPTSADRQHALTILETLQRKRPLFNDRWVKRLFPSPSDPKTADEEGTWNVASTLQANENCSQVPALINCLEWVSLPNTWASDGDTAINAPDAAQEEDELEWAAAGDDPWTSTAKAISHLQPSTFYQIDTNISASGDPWATPSTSNFDVSSRNYTPDSLSTQQLLYKGNLNLSQLRAVVDMLDEDKDISVIQGPPGTGKTTVIAAYVTEILSQPGKSCLIIAESNVAIKNVGEKLFETGITDWLLIVSSEFLSGWHEHLYEQIPNVNLLASKDMMRGHIHARIILCTLNMLSNSKFREITRRLRFASVILEEASQIPMISYLPMVAKYGKHLKKMIFIGDDKQLPPFGSESADALGSIFENNDLLVSLQISFLDIQYRMPPVIGNFISRRVYNNCLSSWDDHPVQSPLCVRFIDVGGTEEHDKTSFKNSAEISASLLIARHLIEKQKSFKLITPYETQRDLLEQKLKSSDLTWTNTCFTVDSFQGNEDDYIIISIVKTKSIGFLYDIRRSNVMLSRARKGMFICSNRSFLQSSGAQNTLMGMMAKEWTEIDRGWISYGDNLTEQLHVE